MSRRRLILAMGLLGIAGIVAACGLQLPWLSGGSAPTPSPIPTATASPTATPTATPMSALDAFVARVTAADFQAGGAVTGSVTVQTLFGSSSGPITGTFEVKGGDSSISIAYKFLGLTQTNDEVVVGSTAYMRANGGQWSSQPAPSSTLQSFVGSVVLVDEGVKARFGRPLHRLAAPNVQASDLAAFGISAGPDRQNLAVQSLSFWSESDGTPAGLSIEASFDQKVLGMTAHASLTLDVDIDQLSGVTIEPPTS